MAIAIHVQIDIDPEPARAGRKRRQIYRDAQRAGAVLWHREMLPEHYKAAASGRYGYDQRSESTKRKKRREHSQGRIPLPDRPLFHSGLTARKTRSFPKIRAFPTRSVVEMHAPSYIKIVPRSGRPSLYDEIIAITAGEIRLHGRTQGRVIDKGLAALEKSRGRKKTVRT